MKLTIRQKKTLSVIYATASRSECMYYNELSLSGRLEAKRLFKIIYSLHICASPNIQQCV